VLLLFVSLLTPRATQAADGDATAVYTGVPATPEAAARVAEMLALLKPPVTLAAPPTHLEGLAPAGTLLAPTHPAAARCRGDELDRAAYQQSLDELVEAVWEVDDLAPLFEDVRDSQPCLTEPALPADLARVGFIEGVMAFEVSEVDRAEATFAAMFAIDPAYPWDGQFGPGAKGTFDETARAVADGPRVRLAVHTATGAEAWIDGRPVTTPITEVAPGRHLVQVRDSADAPLRAVALDLTADQHGVVIDADPLDRGDDLAALASALFSAQQDAGTAPPTYLVAADDSPAAWWWDGSALQKVAIPRTARVVLAGGDDGPRVSPAVPALLSVGAGLVVGGVVLAAVSNKDLREFSVGVESGEIWPFPGPNAESPQDYPLYTQWEGKRNRLGAGYTLIAVGGAAMVLSIPVGVLTTNKGGPEIALGASPLALDTPAGPTLDGCMFTVTLHPEGRWAR